MSARNSSAADRNGDELLAVSDVVARLGVSLRTFYRWRELGKAPRAIVLPNRELRIYRSEFEEWLDGLAEEVAA